MASKGKNFRKKARDDSDDEGGGAPRPGPPPAKRPALVNSFGAVTKQADAVAERAEAAVAELHSFASTRSAKAHDYGGGAFATTEVDTAIDRDAQAIFEKKLAMQQDAAAVFESGKPREYKGMAGYSNFIPKDVVEAKSQAKMAGTMGPLRAPTNIRGICRVDYQPDTCKDYTQTGFCSFGDSCKFLHDRSERKASYLIDKEWDAEQKRKRQALERKLRGGGDDDDADDAADGAAESTGRDGSRREELPFACHICRQKFTKPVVTQCGHYFCEGCAVQRYAANPNCAVCAKPTLGIFNVARKLLAREAAPDIPEDDGDAAGGFGSWSDARAEDVAPGSGRSADAESGSGSTGTNESGDAAVAVSRSDGSVAAPAP